LGAKIVEATIGVRVQLNLLRNLLHSLCELFLLSNLIRTLEELRVIPSMDGH
jgi:hypothetical protein